jgi:diphosphomevalonate decarboxylase
MKAIAQAHSNIALIKYWGKRDNSLNLPAVGSISVTLAEIKTISQVHFRKDLKKDLFILNGQEADPREGSRVNKFLDLVREMAGISMSAEIISHNNFPTGAGLASSASAFASLALASSQAAALKLTSTQLSILARRGSGSAARSIFGGFVEMQAGKKLDGSDSFAVQLRDEKYWDIHLLIAITSEKKKDIGSTRGMEHTARSSPYYPTWVRTSAADLKEMRQAITEKNFSKLGELSESSCLKMHAVAMSSKPGLVYWNGATIQCLQAIHDLRRQGCEVYFTIDAGPQVKAICLSPEIETVKRTLENTSGVLKVISSRLGGDAVLLENVNWDTL